MHASSRKQAPCCRFVHDNSHVSVAEAAAGKLRLAAALKHKFLQALEVDITLTFGGTDSERIVVRGPVVCTRQCWRMLRVHACV